MSGSQTKNDEETVQTEPDPDAYRKPRILESTPEEVRNVVVRQRLELMKTVIGLVLNYTVPFQSDPEAM